MTNLTMIDNRKGVAGYLGAGGDTQYKDIIMR